MARRGEVLYAGPFGVFWYPQRSARHCGETPSMHAYLPAAGIEKPGSGWGAGHKSGNTPVEKNAPLGEELTAQSRLLVFIKSNTRKKVGTIATHPTTSTEL